MSENKELEFTQKLSTSLRAVIFTFGLVPLFAPYELLYKPDWQTYFHFFFALCLFISLGAITISIFFFAFALIGLDRTISFDPETKTVFYLWSAPLIKLKRQSWPFSAIANISFERQSWTEGPDYFQLKLHFKDGSTLEFARFAKEREASAAETQLKLIIA